MNSRSKCLITIRDGDLKIMIETDITDLGFAKRWDYIRDLVARHCHLGQRLESIVFFKDEHIIKNKNIEWPELP